MIDRHDLATCLGALVLSASPLASSLAQSTIEYRSVAEAKSALLAKPGATSKLQNGWLIVDEKPGVTWSFTPRGHEAYPAVGKRVLFQGPDGRFRVLTLLKCEASKPACDRLAQSYRDLDKAMIEALKRRPKAPQ